MFVVCCTGSSPCNEVITCSGESYRVRACVRVCVCERERERERDLETSTMRQLRLEVGFTVKSCKLTLDPPPNGPSCACL